MEGPNKIRETLVVVPDTGDRRGLPEVFFVDLDAQVSRSKADAMILGIMSEIEATAYFEGDEVVAHKKRFAEALKGYLDHPNFPKYLRRALVRFLDRHDLAEAQLVASVAGQVRRKIDLLRLLDADDQGGMIDISYPIYAYLKTVLGDFVNSTWSFAANTSLGLDNIAPLMMADRGKIYLGQEACLSLPIPSDEEILLTLKKIEARRSDLVVPNEWRHLEGLELQTVEEMLESLKGGHLEKDQLRDALRPALRAAFQGLYDRREALRKGAQPKKRRERSAPSAKLVEEGGGRRVVIGADVLGERLPEGRILSDSEAYRRKICEVIGIPPVKAGFIRVDSGAAK